MPITVAQLSCMILTHKTNLQDYAHNMDILKLCLLIIITNARVIDSLGFVQFTSEYGTTIEAKLNDSTTGYGTNGWQVVVSLSDPVINFRNVGSQILYSLCSNRDKTVCNLSICMYFSCKELSLLRHPVTNGHFY